MPKRKRPHQLELTGVTRPIERCWGGARKGAGRKRKSGARAGVPHVARPPHKKRHPVHVTLRARGDLPSFRAQRIERLLREVLTRQKKRRYESSFQVAHFSIQAEHLHLIVEADETTLRTGVSGFVISFARLLNKMLSRSGRVWADRYHRHDLATPSEVRNALRYLFQNWKKHSIVKAAGFVDPYSSAGRFDGWSGRVQRVWQDTEPWPACRPRTWLLAEGWRKSGVLDVDDRAGHR